MLTPAYLEPPLKQLNHIITKSAKHRFQAIHNLAGPPAQNASEICTAHFITELDAELEALNDGLKQKRREKLGPGYKKETVKNIAGLILTTDDFETHCC